MNKFIKSYGFWIVLIIVLFGAYYFMNSATETKNIVFSDLVSEIQNSNIKSIQYAEGTVTVVMKDTDELKKCYIPSLSMLYDHAGESIKQQVEKNELTISTPKPESFPWWLSMLPTFIIIIIMISFTLMMFRQSGGSGRNTMNFGKSKAKIHEHGKTNVTFNDVAGADAEKEELEEIVEFLKAPQKFHALGAKIPRGVLLVGPPGTGKTLLAKAVAGEAKVPFFSISGSDFVEMFVGVGASRVRDLFEQAKKAAPSIVFIDEIDAVGRQRGAGLGGGHDEREQTLNQLLVEMDGFEVNQGVIVIAATNRPDILDNALLRPGRFDRQVVVDVPDMKGREAILKVHARNKVLDPSVDLGIVARTTAGFTGADLANLLNEAALLAARYNLRTIGMEEIENAMIKVVVGTEKKTRVMNEKEKKLTAFHEAGHAVISKLLPSQDPVHQISIIPRGRAGGYTMNLPSEDKSYTTKGEILDSIAVLLGGRAAEKITLDDISTGASNDIERASKAARQMVTKYGMSDTLGPVCYGSQNDEVFIGRDFVQSKNLSENVSAKIDAEVTEIIENQYKRCIELLNENIDKLNNVANALIENEKLSREEFEKVFNGETLEAYNPFETPDIVKENETTDK
ncbi:MAG: ATP-dependent zinc metalloprotease FtsH [Clostridia bacterium]|nr:ATP-dependent zinc metalloprotease FtsH [Clostridia bacterium]MBO7289065.1 ATP-dependent zinc metalloprotease FtsH [Clostridia bacterium]